MNEALTTEDATQVKDAIERLKNSSMEIGKAIYSNQDGGAEGEAAPEEPKQEEAQEAEKKEEGEEKKEEDKKEEKKWVWCKSNNWLNFKGRIEVIYSI